MRILLLSPYDALSHRYWHEGLVQAMSDWHVTTVTLPPRHFAWRFRGNALALSRRNEIDGDYDAVIATSMTDLATLRGLCPHIARCPNIVYFHENQFDYPVGRGRVERRLEQQLTSVYTALAADTLIFNSAYNRRTFMEGAAALLGKMPDQVPANVVASLDEKARVMPVPLVDDCYQPRRSAAAFSIVWNHRWEYDKGPEQLLDIVTALIDADFHFEFHLIGQPFREVPPPLEAARERLAAAGRLGRTGFLPRGEYLELLAGARVVLSTAVHEFQGLAVLEAIASGCIPVVPDRLAYREYVDAAHRYDSASQAVAMMGELAQQFHQGEYPEAPDVSGLAWSAQRHAWAHMLS